MKDGGGVSCSPWGEVEPERQGPWGHQGGTLFPRGGDTAMASEQKAQALALDPEHFHSR